MNWLRTVGGFVERLRPIYMHHVPPGMSSDWVFTRVAEAWDKEIQNAHTLEEL